MPTRQSVESLRTANKGVVRLIQRDLAALWGSLDLTKPDVSRDMLLAVTPGLVAKYGRIAGTVAADWYDTERAQAKVRRKYRAVPASPVPDVAVISTVRRTAGALFTDEPALMFNAISQVFGSYAIQPSRSTISFNAGKDHARWARIPTGTKTCAFCLVLASRGFSYGSEESAGLDPNTYHSECDCIPTPDWSDEPHLDGYEPDDFYQTYQAARQESGSGDMKAILSTLRKQEGTP